jgi:predicted AAA+ superfamily ATPase
MTFKRKIYADLLDWKRVSNGGTAILLEGARRVGKSTIVEEFAKNEYEDYLLLDFALESQEVKSLFENKLNDLDAFYRDLFLLKGRSLPKRNAAIIFDEVQLFFQARQAIKYLVKDGRYDFIETGSLISIKNKTSGILLPSEEYRINMYPMDFEEFLWASGDQVTMPAIREAFSALVPMGNAIHRKIMEKFRLYMAVGGMPQAVDALLKGNTYEQIDFIKRAIISLYEDDLHKCGDQASAIFRVMPSQLTQHGASFKFASINPSARYVNYAHSLELVSDSMIANRCVNVTEPSCTPGLNIDHGNFKLYFADTGLLVTQMMRSKQKVDADLYRALIFDKLSANLGMIVENMVAQMLRASGYELFFHEFEYTENRQNKPAKYEIDFLLVRDKRVCPIEVKSSNYRTHKSFAMFKAKYQLKQKERYIIYCKDLSQADGIVCLPLYMTPLL